MGPISRYDRNRDSQKPLHSNGRSGHTNQAYIATEYEGEHTTEYPTGKMSHLYRRRGILGLGDRTKEYVPPLYSEGPDGESLFVGRSAGRWAFCIGFYFAFYFGLGCFLAICFTMWLRVIVDLDSPKYSGPMDGMAWTPGLSIRPILDLQKKSTLLHYTRSNDSQIEYIREYMWEDFLKSYDFDQNSENGNFIDCTAGRTDNDTNKVCEFKLDYLLPCRKEDDFGWADGQPCIILKLNRIDKWIPELYEKDELPEELEGFDYDSKVIPVKCFGSDSVSNELLGEVEYYPQQGFSTDYYPFIGQQGYKQPLVAVQFMSLTHRQLLFITCKAYTKNMVYNEIYNLGMTRFEMISD